MLKSLNSLLSEVNAQPHHKRWIKYYKKNFVISKEFNSVLPSLSKFSSIFPFKEIDSSLLKKSLVSYKSNPNISLDIELAKLLKIDQTSIPDNIDELCNEVSKIPITKSNEKHLNLVFDCITRFFICYSYQFDSIFLSAKRNISFVQSFVTYFLLYQKHQRFTEDVLILFKSFLNSIKKTWDSIFQKQEIGCQQQIDLIYIIRLLIPISKASIEETKDNSIFEDITKQSFSIFQDIEPRRFSLQFFDPVYQIFTNLIELIPIIDSVGIDLLRSIASSVLSLIPNFSLYENSQKYQLGSLFLRIYSYSEISLTDETAKQQFNVIIGYVLWIVFTFREKRVISDDYEESMNKKELQPIGVTEYFKNVQFIPAGEPLISNQYLTQSANMLNQMIQQSKYKSLLISLLIDAMDKNQKKMEIEQYQSFSAFVLYVIHNCSDESLASGFSNYWNVLISEALFPEKNEFDDRNLRDAVLKIFMRCFIAVPSSRSVILNSISEYFTKHRINELRYFLPLFNNLLALDQDIKFAQELIKSPLMNFLLTESKQYLEIFDLIRHIMFLHSKSCFESRTILKFCFDCIKVPLYRNSMMKCLENALITCTREDDAQHVVTSLICEISSLIQSSLKNDIDLAKQFVLILGQSMKSFRPETIPTLFIASTFEILAQSVLEINTTEIFQLVLSVFIDLCHKNNSVYQYFLNKECQVYTYLTFYMRKADSEYKHDELLFDFAFLNSDNKKETLIRNYHAIPLILEWAKNKEFETKIYSKIYDICKDSSANVYELVKADIYTFIIDRIENIGFNESTEILFKIYTRIASISLPNSAYFDTLKLICLPKTDFPEKFISLFNSFLEQLKKGTKFHCNSFFHFEQPSNGIFGPNSQHFGNKFSFVTMIRCECLNSKDPIPLFKLISDKNDQLEFTILNQQIVMNRKSTYVSNSDNNNGVDNSSNQTTTKSFSLKLSKNEGNIEFWNRIIIVIEPSQVTLCINDCKEQLKITSSPFQSTTFNVTIGNGFVGDMSDTYFLNEVNLEKINKNISNKSIICQYIPRNVKDNAIHKVCKNQASFNGQSILYVNTILDIIKNESAVMRLLPLFARFSCCNSCSFENSSKRCNVCGSLEIDEGFDFLEKLLTFVTIASSENAFFMKSKHFFSVLSYYFERMNRCYFTTRFFNLLLSCFRLIENNELAQEMIESIFFNYELIMKYSKEKQNEYFSEILPKAYSIQKDVFHSYKQFNFLVFLAIAYYPDESEISKSLWENILTILPNRTDYVPYTLLLAIPMFHHYNFSSEMILDCFEKMIDNQNNFFLKALESMEYFIPFAYIFKFPQIKLQLQAFRIISKLRSKCETSDLIRAIYQIIEFYQPSENSIELLNFAHSIFLNEEGSIENAEYFPLIVTISSYIEKDDAFPVFENIMHSIYDFQVEAMKITTGVFNWPYWLLKYIIQFYKEVDENTISKFSLPFASLIEAQICSLKLQYQEIFAQIMTVSQQFNINSREIIKEILQYLFTQGHSTLSLSGPDLFKDVFIFIFFNDVQLPKKVTISPTPSKSSSLDRFCWYSEQSVVTYYFELRTKIVDEKLVWIDQQLAESFASKISLLSNVNVTIFDEQYNGLLLATYVLVMLMRFKSELAISLINEKLVNELNQADQEIAQKCASYVLRTRDCMLYEEKEEAENYLNKINFEQFSLMTTFFVDKEDSNSLQLFLFENSLYQNTKEINESMLKLQTNYITESNKFTSFVLNIDVNSIDADLTDKNEKRYFSSSTVSYSNLMVIYADLLNSQDFYFTNSKYYRKQIADSFLKEYFVLTTDKTNINIKFKALNNISRKGRRVLLSIDYNKLNANSLSKSKKSRFSSASIYDAGKIDNTIVRHNKIQVQPTENLVNKASKSKGYENDIFKEKVGLLTPRRLYQGQLIVVGKNVTFDGTDSVRSKHIEFSIDQILFIMKRTYGRNRKAVEVFTETNRSHYFVFSCSYGTKNKTSKNKKNSNLLGSSRHNFNVFISSRKNLNSSQDTKYDFFNDLSAVYGAIYQKKKKEKLPDLVSKLEITDRWQKRKISNYEYLYYLNILSGRSFNDLSKYPVFPIILLNKPVLDRRNPNVSADDSYRNLGHPVCAIQPEKLKKLLNSFNSVEDMKNKYFYSSLFSNPFIVSNLLSKIEPFTSIYAEIEHKKSINIVVPKKSNDDEEQKEICINDSSSSDVNYEFTPEFFSFPPLFGQIKTRILPKPTRKLENKQQQQAEEEKPNKNEGINLINNDKNENKQQQKEEEKANKDDENITIENELQENKQQQGEEEKINKDEEISLVDNEENENKQQADEEKINKDEEISLIDNEENENKQQQAEEEKSNQEEDKITVNDEEQENKQQQQTEEEKTTVNNEEQGNKQQQAEEEKSIIEEEKITINDEEQENKQQQQAEEEKMNQNDSNDTKDQNEDNQIQIPSLNPRKSNITPPLFSLPSWSSSPDEFININRRALESDTTTSNINKWIDLIFGCNRCSPSNLNVYRPLLYPENDDEKSSQKEKDQQAIENGLYPIQIFTKSHPIREKANLLPFEQNLSSSSSTSQNVIIKYESKKAALRIRKNFLITEDLQVIKFTFKPSDKMKQTPSRKELHRTKSTINESHFQKPSSLTPQSPQLKVRKNVQLQVDSQAQAGDQNSPDDLVRTTVYSVPEILDNSAPDIIEVSRSLLLLIFGNAGNSTITISDLRKCKTDRTSGNSSSNNEANNNNNSNFGTSEKTGKTRTFSDLDERPIGSALSNFNRDDIFAFNSVPVPEPQKMKKTLKSSDDQSDLNNGSSSSMESGSKLSLTQNDQNALNFGSIGFSLINNTGPNNANKIIRFENAAVQCISLSGGTILSVGLSDGTVRVFQLPNLNLIHSSSYHNRPILSIAGNRELGLLVSIDNQYRLIFELLYENRFIRVQKLGKIIMNEIENEKNSEFFSSFSASPFLIVFKSGTVAAVVNKREENSSFVVFFSVCGDFRGFLKLNGVVKETDKYYDFDSREILVVAVEPRKIVLIDVAKFEILSILSGSFGQLRFCTVKYLRSIMYGNGRITQTLPFSLTQKPIL